MPSGFLKVSSPMQTNASLQERFAVLHKRFLLHSAYWQVVSYFVINTAVKFPSVISQPYPSGRTRSCITSRECHRTHLLVGTRHIMSQTFRRWWKNFFSFSLSFGKTWSISARPRFLVFALRRRRGRILWLLACGHTSISGRPFSPPENNGKSGDRKCVFIRRLGGLGSCRLV